MCIKISTIILITIVAIINGMDVPSVQLTINNSRNKSGNIYKYLLWFVLINIPVPIVRNNIRMKYIDVNGKSSSINTT